MPGGRGGGPGATGRSVWGGGLWLGDGIAPYDGGGVAIKLEDLYKPNCSSAQSLWSSVQQERAYRCCDSIL